ncbi:MAG: prepilin-type N-terminal cleavage/methylation domain-containing protein [Pseudoramibacter sp.]
MKLRNHRGMTLTELLITLIILGLTAGLLPGFVAVFTKEPKGSSARSHAQDFRHVHVFIEKTVRAADSIVIDGQILYVRDLETPKYYDVYVLNSASHILYRDKYYDNFTPLVSGSRSQLDAEVADFELAPEWQDNRPNGVFRLKMRYIGEETVYETEIYAPDHEQTVVLKNP